MRKLTQILFALLCLCNINAWAQPLNFGDPLITSGDQISSPFSDRDEGTGEEHGLQVLCDFNPSTFWHSDWHGDVPGDRHWVQFEFPEPVEGNMVLWIQRRHNSDTHIATKAELTGSLTADFTITVPIATLELGNAQQGAEFTSDVWNIPEPVKYIRFTLLENTGGSKFFHMAEMNFYKAPELEVLMEQLNNLLNNYDAYLWGEFEETFNLGSGSGQYTDREAAELFYKNLQYIAQIVAGEVETPSAVEIRALIDETTEAWNKYKDSQLAYIPEADGYYRIISNLDYYKDVETGELDEFGNPATRREYMKKAMYANLDSVGCWHTLDPEDCRDVWYITRNEDRTVNIKNAATQMGFWKVEGSGVKMTEDPDSFRVMVCDWAGYENDHDVIYIRRNEDPKSEKGHYLHQVGHSRGAGTEGNLCGWNATFEMGLPYDSDKGTSEWYLVPVPEEEALALIEAYAAIKDHDLLVAQYRNLEAKAKAGMAIAQRAPSENLITSTSQFSSMVTEPKEGSLDNLLDNNSATFWHSNWSDGNRPMGTHTLDVTLNDPIEGEVRMWILRRGNSDNDDNPTIWGVYGSNDESALQVVADFANSEESEWAAQTIAGWEVIVDSLSTPWTKNVKEVTSDYFNITTPYKYLRFVCKETKGPNYTNRGYFHMGDLQIEQVIGARQIENMGEVGATMLAVLEKGANTPDADLTIDDLNNLKAAYEAFKEKLADPTDMENAVRKYRDYSKMLAIGEEPGFWTDDTQATALDKAIEAASAYDKAGIFEQAQLDAHTKAVTDAADAFLDAAHKISTDKWYRIRFASEEDYTTHNWDQGNIHPDEGGPTNLGDLWGQYASVARLLNTGEFESAHTVEPLATEDMREGNSLYFSPLESIVNEDAALFRFVNIGDTAYIIQNKATGLFVNCEARNNHNVTMNLNPTTFQVKAIGYGAILMAGKQLDGEDVTNLHGQRADHRLVTWESAEPQSNSGLRLETAADVADDAANSFTRDLELGVINTYCSAAAVKATEGEVGFYTVAGTYTDEEEGYYVALNSISETQPGVPYLAIAGTPEDYDGEAETPQIDAYTFEQLNTGFAAKADSINGLVGTYKSVNIPKGYVVFQDNTAVTSEDKIIDNGDGTFTSTTNRTIGAYKAYLKFGFEADPEGTYDIVLKVGGDTPPTLVGIDRVLNQVAKNGQLYDLNGRLLKKNATLNDVKALGRGMYILNGVKIMVK